eukprot:m.119753 g.119753  ORF g.119753 m.119753 type:complete len:105 (+) comp23194_c0_seq10:697-1011(+)
MLTLETRMSFCVHSIENIFSKALVTPLCAAARSMNLPILQLLLQKGANVNAEHGAALRGALKYFREPSHYDNVRALLAAGADPNAVDPVRVKTIASSLKNTLHI